MSDMQHICIPLSWSGKPPGRQRQLKDIKNDSHKSPLASAWAFLRLRQDHQSFPSQLLMLLSWKSPREAKSPLASAPTNFLSPGHLESCKPPSAAFVSLFVLCVCVCVCVCVCDCVCARVFTYSVCARVIQYTLVYMYMCVHVHTHTHTRTHTHTHT